MSWPAFEGIEGDEGAQADTAAGLQRAISIEDLERAARGLAAGVRPWEAGGFAHLRTLQAAHNSCIRVDEMSRGCEGARVAVKRLPTWWAQGDQAEFRRCHPRDEEQPWLDLAVLSELNRRHFPYACDLVGVFCDGEWTYAATQLASHGDLFTWSASEPAGPGPDREAAMRPIVDQLCTALRWLHELGVAHCDLCLENVVLAGGEPGGAAPLRPMLIDFGRAALGRLQGVPGGPQGGCQARAPYRAPELHRVGWQYDAFLADEFALGVAVYGMATVDYPWACTEDGRSHHFDLARRCGVPALLRRRAARSGERLTEALSLDLLGLLAGLLALEARDRLSVGEACFELEGRASARRSPWIREVTAGAPADTAARMEPPPALCREPSRTSSASTADTEADQGQHVASEGEELAAAGL